MNVQMESVEGLRRLVKRNSDGRLELNLSEKRLTEVPEVVSQLTEVEVLNLSDNPITDIPESLSKLNRLKILLCKNCKFKSLNILPQLTTVETLDLSGTRISNLLEYIVQLKGLRTLCLSDCGLTEVCDLAQLISLENLDHVDKLELKTCELTEVAAGITQLTSLEELGLSENPIKTLPQAFSNLKHLKKLELSNCGLTDVGAGIIQLTSLEELGLSKNPIKTLPQDFPNLKHLKKLELNDCELKDVGAGIIQLTSLEELDLSGNLINTLPQDFSKLKHLKKLELNDCGLKDVGAGITQLTSLEELNLRNNSIKTLPQDLSNLKHLKILDMWNCGLTEVGKGLTELQHLQKLYLDDCELTEIPEEMCGMKSLTFVSIRNNKLRKLPLDVTKMASLKQLELERNPLQMPPLEVCKQGVQAVFSYIAEIRLARVVHQKIVLLGCSGAGKTSLATTLVNRKSSCVEKEDRTIVLDRIVWETTTQEKNLSVSLIDCGGNDWYEIVQHLFIEETALFFLVVNLAEYSSENFCRDIGNWLKLLHTRVPNANWWLVATHADQCTEESIKDKRKAIETAVHCIYEREGTKMEGSLQIFVVSSGNMTGISTLDGELMRFVSEKGKVIPPAWLELFKKLQSRRTKEEPYLYIKDVEEMDHEVSRKSTRRQQKEQDSLTGTDDGETEEEEEEEEISTEDSLTGIDEEERSSEETLSVEEMDYEVSRKKTRQREQDSLTDHEKTSSDEEMYYEFRRKRNRQQKKQDPSAGIEHEKTSSEEERLRQFSTVGKITHLWEHFNARSIEENHKEELTKYSEVLSRSSVDTKSRLQSILKFFHAIGAILWYQYNPNLSQFIFHNPEYLTNLLKTVFTERLETESLGYDKHLKSTFSSETFQKAKEDLLQQGIMSCDLLQCLWKNRELDEEVFTAMIHLFMHLDFCYALTTDQEGHVTSLRFPWFLVERAPEDPDVQQILLGPPAVKCYRISFEYEFLTICPPPMYEKFAVRVHRHIHDKTSRRDWKDGFLAQLFESRVLVQKFHRGMETVISFAVEGKDVVELWEVLMKLKNEMQEVMREWPGVKFGSHYNTLLLCPHCVQQRVKQPFRFPGENSEKECPRRQLRMKCKRDNQVTEVPACLVYNVKESSFHTKHKDVLETFADEMKKDIHDGEKFLKSLLEHCRSVGIIMSEHADGRQSRTGTVFRVGSHFVMTNQHVVQSISECVGGQEYLGDHKSVFVSLNYCSPDQHVEPLLRVFLDSQHPVVWSSEELDAAVLKLDLRSIPSHYQLPTPLDHLWGDASHSTTLYFIGHDSHARNNCVLDLQCPVKKFSDLSAEFLQENPDLIPGLSDQRKTLLSTSLTHGSSGSPGFDQFGHLVVMFTRGFPDESPQVDQAVNIVAIKKQMELDNFDLSTVCEERAIFKAVDNVDLPQQVEYKDEPTQEPSQGREMQQIGTGSLVKLTPVTATKHILLLARVWGWCEDGGLSSVIKETAAQFAKSEEVRVSCLVAQESTELQAAQERSAQVVRAVSMEGYSDLECLSFLPSSVDGVHTVVTFGKEYGKYAQPLKMKYGDSKWVHIACSSEDDSEIKFCEYSTLTFGLGSYVAEDYDSQFSDKTVHKFIPGVFNELQIHREGVQDRTIFSVLSFFPPTAELGAGSMETYSIPAKAVSRLGDKYRLLSVCAPQDNPEELKQILIKHGISVNQLKVLRYGQDVKELCRMLYRANMLILPFLPYKFEAFGLVGLYAISANLPVLISCYTGLGNALGQLPYGNMFIMKSDKAEEWEKQITAVREKDSGQRLSEAKSLRESYEEKFSWERQCEAVLDQILQL